MLECLHAGDELQGVLWSVLLYDNSGILTMLVHRNKNSLCPPGLTLNSCLLSKSHLLVFLIWQLEVKRKVQKEAWESQRTKENELDKICHVSSRIKKTPMIHEALIADIKTKKKKTRRQEIKQYLKVLRERKVQVAKMVRKCIRLFKKKTEKQKKTQEPCKEQTERILQMHRPRASPSSQGRMSAE